MVNKVGWCAAAALLMCSQLSLAADNMRLHGALVAEPCVIPPGDETVVLDFNSVIDKYLYMNTRTPSKPFKLHLTQCDLSLSKTVRVTFSGNESTALPGLLTLDGSSQARGIGIGMENSQGKLLPINQQGKAQALVSGANILTMYAYVQGEPDALKHKAIKPGPFSAVATFSLEYE